MCVHMHIWEHKYKGRRINRISGTFFNMEMSSVNSVLWSDIKNRKLKIRKEYKKVKSYSFDRKRTKVLSPVVLVYTNPNKSTIWYLKKIVFLNLFVSALNVIKELIV